MIVFTYPEISRYIVTLTSISLILGPYHQVYKMFSTKSTDDFSFFMLFSLLICQISWVNYGYILNEWPILLLSCFELPAGALALYGYLKFRNNDESN